MRLIGPFQSSVALEIVKGGRETNWQPVKKNEIVQSTKSKDEDPFIYLRLPPMEKMDGVCLFIKQTLFNLQKRSKLKELVFSWVLDNYVKIVFDSKMSKDELMKRHRENPLQWPKPFGNFEFCNDVPITYIRCPKPNWTSSPWFWVCHVRRTMCRNFETDQKQKIKIVAEEKKATKLMKVIFDTKTTKDEVMEAHKREPFMWPEKLGVFEFLNYSEALSMLSGEGGRNFSRKRED